MSTFDELLSAYIQVTVSNHGCGYPTVRQQELYNNMQGKYFESIRNAAVQDYLAQRVIAENTPCKRCGLAAKYSCNCD